MTAAAPADRPVPGATPVSGATPVEGVTPARGEVRVPGDLRVPGDDQVSDGIAVPAGVPGRPAPGQPAAPGGAVGVFDPLRLCIFSTVALLTWIFGPFAVLAFAVLGLAGYVRAHRAGLRRSRCYLRDVRLVLAYLGTLAVVALAASGLEIASWIP